MQVTITPPRTHELHLGEKNTITAAEDFLAVKSLNAAGCNEVGSEMVKAFNSGVFLLTHVCQVTYFSGRTP